MKIAIQLLSWTSGYSLFQILCLFVAKLQSQRLANLRLSVVCSRTPSFSRLHKKLISETETGEWNGQMCATWAKFSLFQCMRFYEIYLNEALSFQHCLHSRCFRWDENCFIALDVDFGLFIVSDFKFIYGKTAVSTLGKLTAVIDLFSHAIVFSTTQETYIRLNQKQEMKWTDVCYLGQIFPIFNARYSMKFIWRRRRRNIYKYGEKLFRFLR